MLTHTLPDLRIANISIPGGWQIGVPEISVDRETREMVRAAGMDMAEFDTAMQNIFETGMIKSVGRFVVYWAKQYAKMFPDLLDEDSGELGGYDVEDLVRYWLPVGRGGGKVKVDVRAQLMEYARIERRRRDGRG